MTTLSPPVNVHPGPPPDPPERPEGLPPRIVGADRWKPWTAILVLVVALAAPLVLGIVAAVGVAIAGGDVEELPPGVLIALTFAQDVGFILAPLMVAGWFASRPRARDFGLTMPARPWVALAILAGVYFGFLAFSGIWISALGIDQEDQLPNELGVDDSTAALVLVLVLVTIVAPVAEELLFRGYMYRALRNWRGIVPAAVISGAIFGGIHAGSSPVGFLVPLAALGVGLALLYEWTGSLVLPVALHAINNSIAFGVSQDWTWEIAVTVVGATAASLGGLWLLGRGLGDGPAGSTHRAPEPGVVRFRAP